MSKIKTNDGNRLDGGVVVVAWIFAALLIGLGVSIGWALCAWIKFGCEV
jgi:hypothetical protein